TILHELNPLFTINVTMRDIKSKNVYSRVNSKATTQWRKTESANGVHLVCRLLLEKKNNSGTRNIRQRIYGRQSACKLSAPALPTIYLPHRLHPSLHP